MTFKEIGYIILFFFILACENKKQREVIDFFPGTNSIKYKKEYLNTNDTTDVLIYRYYSPGKIMDEQHYVKGHLVASKNWYENGNVESEGVFFGNFLDSSAILIDGKVTEVITTYDAGTKKKYNIKGNKVSETKYLRDKHLVISTKWDSLGVIIKKDTFHINQNSFKPW